MRKFSVVTFILFLSLLASARVLAFQVESSGPILGPQVNNSTENKGCFTNLAFGQFSFYFSFTDSVYFPNHHVHYFVFLGADEADPSRVTLSADLVTTFRGIRVGTNNIIVPFCEGASATAEFLLGSEQRHAPFSASFSKITYEEYVGLVRGFGGTPRPNSGDRIGHVVIDLGVAGGSASISNMSSALCPFDPRTDNFVCPSYPLTQPYESFKELANVQINVPPATPCSLTVEVSPSEVLPFGTPTTRRRLQGLPRKATVTATCDSTTAVPIGFRLEPPTRIGSIEIGGHDHSLGRPVGHFEDDDGQPTQGCSTDPPPDGSGDCHVIYVPSEVAGTEAIVATTPDGQEVTVLVTARVPDLRDLPDNPAFYAKVGTVNTTNDPCRRTPVISLHGNSHNATGLMQQVIANIAGAVKALTGALLRVNDISLPLGGLFDIDNDWNTPHVGHRVGDTADLGTNVIKDQQCAETPRIKALIGRVIKNVTGFLPLEEGDPPHWHAVLCPPPANQVLGSCRE